MSGTIFCVDSLLDTNCGTSLFQSTLSLLIITSPGWSHRSGGLLPPNYSLLVFGNILINIVLMSVISYLVKIVLNIGKKLGCEQPSEVTVFFGCWLTGTQKFVLFYTVSICYLNCYFHCMYCLHNHVHYHHFITFINSRNLTHFNLTCI